MIVRRLKRLFCDHKYEYVGMESVGASYGCDVLFHDEYHVRCVKCGKGGTAYSMAQVDLKTKNSYSKIQGGLLILDSIRELEIGIKFSKILNLISLINMVDGKEVHHLDFIDKDEEWLDHHIDYYIYALSLNK